MRSGITHLFLTLTFWYLSGAKVSVLVLVACFLFALLVLRGVQKFKLSSQAVTLLVIGIGVIPSFKFLTSLPAFRSAYYSDHSERRHDLAKLQRLPAIYPQRLYAGVPQRHHVYAPESESLQLEIGSESYQTTRLGQGIFVADLALSHKTQGDEEGQIEVTLTTDDGAKTLSLPIVATRSRPGRLRSDESGSKVTWVSQTTDEGFLATEEGSSRSLVTGDGPAASVFSDSSGSQLAISHAYGDGVWFYDAREAVVTKKLSLEGQLGELTPSPDFSTLAIASVRNPRGIYFVDLDSHETEFLPLDAKPEWLSFGRDQDEIVISSRTGLRLWVFRKEATGWALRYEQSLTRPLTFLSRSPGGDRISGGATLSDLTTGDVGGNHRIVNSVVHLNLESLAFERPWVTEGRSPAQLSPGSLDFGISPMAMDSHEGGEVHIAFAGTSEVIRYSKDGQRLNRVDLREESLRAPRSLASLASGGWAVASPAEGTVGFFDRKGKLSKLLDLNLPDPFDAREESDSEITRIFGEIAFFESTQSGISCQSCHTYGESDYSRHDIGGGSPVGTLSAMGVAGTAPYLRDGSYPTLASLHDVAQGLYRGYQNREEEGLRADQMATYLTNSPRPSEGLRTPPDPTTLLEVRRGAVVFGKAGCASCHTPPAFTDLSTVPSRRLFPEQVRAWGQSLDTPSLLALRDSAPYLHDGRAPTLASIFESENPANFHGDTKDLTANEIRSLVAFLKAL